MKIHEGSFVLTNVLSLKQTVDNEEWSDIAILLRNHVVTEGIYPIGPVVFEREQVEGEPNMGTYTFYVALNEKVELTEESEYEFDDIIAIPNAIYIRYSDLDGEITEAYNLLEQYALENQLQLAQNFFHVGLDVFGEMWFDIYAPIIGNDKDVDTYDQYE